ncbi:MAG: DUF4349 domain-containing protein [Crocinitomicaceae bacterium]
MKMRRLAISTLLLSLTFTACGGGDTSEGSSMEMWENAADDYGSLEELDMSEDYEPNDQMLTEQDLVLMDRKLIKTANLSFEVENLNDRTKVIRKALQKYKGYTLSEEDFTTYDRENIQMEMKVPSENFEAFLADVSEGVEHFESKDISAQDVTEEFIDIEARIKTKKEVEQQFIGLLEKANSINDIMEIEERIGYVRQEIESAEGRLKYLASNTSYSTVSLSYFVQLEEPSKYGREFSDSFYGGWDVFVMLFVGLTALWPFIILGLCIFFLIRHYSRKNKARKQIEKS